MSQTDLHPAPQPPNPPKPKPEMAAKPTPPAESGGSDGTKGDSQRQRPDKVRIYDLARDLGKDNREILDICDQVGIPYKSHSSTISGEQADQVRAALGNSSSARPAAPTRPTRVSKPQPKPQSAKSSSKAGDRTQILNVRPPERPQISRPTSAEGASGSADSGSTSGPQRPEPPASGEAKRPDSPSLVRPPKRPESGPRPAAQDKTEGDEGGKQPVAPARPEAPTAQKDTPSSDQERDLQRPAPPARPQRPAAEASAPPAEPSLEAKPEPTPPSTPAPGPRKPAPKRQEAPAPELLAKPVPPKPPERPARAERQAPQPKPEAPAKPKLSEPRAPAARSERGARPSRPERPEPPTKPAVRTPQLVGAPVRPKSQAKPDPAIAEQPKPAQADEEKAPQRPKLLQRKPSKPDLVSPPARHPAQEETPAPVLADAPVRPAIRLKRKDEEEEDDELSLLKKPTRSQTKKKRSRRKTTDGEGDGSELDVLASVSAAKQAELNALKPLPRPSAKPKSSVPPAPKSKPQPSTPKPRRGPQQQPAAAVAAEEDTRKVVTLDSNITVQELAARMSISETEIIKLLFLKGFMVNINQVLDIPTMELVAKDLGYEVEFKEEVSQAKKTEMLDIEDIDHLVIRPPVVTIMGHVDHGKTTLLDAIRDTKVVEGEAGGITQRIGAYHVDVDLEGDLRRVVFLDTPGHEAFTSMRARGAKVTDIAVLVVAADDGVQPQTLEAISHAKAAEVPIVVAVNKIDKPASQPDRIKQQLSEHGLVPEEWGGDTPMVDVSALARLNLDSLLEMLLLVADIGELQANPSRPARGTVVEANLDKARGPLATILIQNGTLRVGDPVVAGSIFGRVKAMIDDRGQRLEEAGPSSAVQLLGLSDVPAAGDEFTAYPNNEREARRIADERAEGQRQERLQQQMLSRRVSLGKVSADAQEGKLKELNLIVKTDVQGSAEAILASLQQINQEEVQVRILLAAPGEIVETDVDLAAASEAIIIGFSTNVSSHVRQLADRYGVDIREYDIIYNLLEDITGAMEGLLEPEEVEEHLGEAEVRMVIPIGKGAIAGCSVRSGKMMRNALIRVRRQGDVIFSGRLDSLKRFKDDVREVASGFECGIGVDKFQDWAEGDIVEAHQMVTKRRTLITAESGRR